MDGTARPTRRSTATQIGGLLTLLGLGAGAAGAGWIPLDGLAVELWGGAVLALTAAILHPRARRPDLQAGDGRDAGKQG